MSRSIGSVILDDNVNSFVVQIIPPTSRVVQTAMMINRQGRAVREREDRDLLTIPVMGVWIDGGGKFFRDFKASLLSQKMARFDFGDGTGYKAVDVTRIQATRMGGIGGQTAPNEAYKYTMDVLSYEPFTRELTPTLQTAGTLTTGNGSNLTSFNIAYPGTAFAEPTWQFVLSIPNGVTVSSVSLMSTATGEQCIVSGLSLTNGTYYVLMDASGSGSSNSPNNNSYGLLSVTSAGYGAFISGYNDVDFAGNIPTLIPNPAPTTPPGTFNNNVAATIAATGVLTSATLQYLAPARYER